MKNINGMGRFLEILRRFASSIGIKDFNWSEAQEYELRNSQCWLKENFESLFPMIEAARQRSELWPGPLDLVVKEFFAARREEWMEFATYIKDKTCLEVGAGPCGALAIWWWVKRRIIVDPLIAEYKRISLELFERTWYTDDIELYAQPAERFIAELSNRIDGAIICRNTLDHCEKPMLVFRNMAAYAKAGCHLLLWTDLWHLKGHNEGHRNITKDKEAFERKVRDLGFEILYSFEDVQRPTINYGCHARKRTVANRD